MTDFNDIKDPEFDIPDGYFQAMEAQVFEKIKQKENKRNRRVFMRWTTYCTGVAAVMCCVFFGIKAFDSSENVSVKHTIVLSNAEEVNTYLLSLQPSYSAPQESEQTDASDILSAVGVTTEKTVISDITTTYEYSSTPTEQEAEKYIMENYNIMELATL
ncbi:MAG: hypothetical protein PHD21_02245 [Flavobacteriales bacterium]|nr:hypothetical protein [Flavobacteriales bacterium]